MSFGDAHFGLGGLSELVSLIPFGFFFFFGQVLLVGANLAGKSGAQHTRFWIPYCAPTYQKNLAPAWSTHAIQCMFLCGEPAALPKIEHGLVQ